MQRYFKWVKFLKVVYNVECSSGKTWIVLNLQSFYVEMIPESRLFMLDGMQRDQSDSSMRFSLDAH